MKAEEGKNGLLVIDEILCMQNPLMGRKTMILPVKHPIQS
jgi:ribosomal protein S24E